LACRAYLPKKAVFIAAQTCHIYRMLSRLGTRAGDRQLFSYHDVCPTNTLMQYDFPSRSF